MDLGVIIDLDLDGQIGHWLARLPCKHRNSTATSNIRYPLSIPKTVSSSRAAFWVQLMPLCSKTLSHSSFNTVEDGQSPNLF